jgi:putative ABC transport system ATP-binding protein
MSLVFKNIKKTHHQNENKIAVLKGASFELPLGSSLAIIGKSGSGKTTLLSILCGLEKADEGEIFWEQKALHNLGDKEWSLLRSSYFGIIFQHFFLIPSLSALENVALPLEILKKPDAYSLAEDWLKKVGLAERAHHFPSQLSGGEQQRVAIARALASGASVIVADEPTGNLDQETGKVIADYLFEKVKEEKKSLLLVTHDRDLASRCDQVKQLHDGVLKTI